MQAKYSRESTANKVIAAILSFLLVLWLVPSQAWGEMSDGADEDVPTLNGGNWRPFR